MTTSPQARRRAVMAPPTLASARVLLNLLRLAKVEVRVEGDQLVIGRTGNAAFDGALEHHRAELLQLVLAADPPKPRRGSIGRVVRKLTDGEGDPMAEQWDAKQVAPAQKER